MGQLDDYLPRPGLSTPLVTILDRSGRVLEDEQRAATRYAIQEGRGADIVFAVGTTGEWHRIDNSRRQQVVSIVVDECRRVSTRAGRRIEAWAGITGHTRAETIANLEHAIDVDADAAVVAPVSIRDCESPVGLVRDEIGRVFERRAREIAVFLYDNAEIAAPGKSPHLHTRDVKEMAKLDYVRGVKVTAGKAVLGNYTRAASHFKLSHEFAIYAGNPYLIFDLFAPAENFRSAIRHRWNRYITQRSMPYGVVAGPSNVFPREWQRAWRVCRAGNSEVMARYFSVLDGYRRLSEFAGSRRNYHGTTVAALKAALKELGVVESDAVAEGTPTLEPDERRVFVAGFRGLMKRRDAVEPGWQSETQAPRPELRRVAPSHA